MIEFVTHPVLAGGFNPELPPASTAYSPDFGHIVDPEEGNGWQPGNDYDVYGYTIGFIVDDDNNPLPADGNTAVFRIRPKRETEPVYVTAPDPDTCFMVTVRSGFGRLVLAAVDGTVSEYFLSEGRRVAIRPGDAYAYQNLSSNRELILEDTARPPFEPEHEVKLDRSALSRPGTPVQPGYNIGVYSGSAGNTREVVLPDTFWELLNED